MSETACAFCKQKLKFCECGAKRELRRDKQFAAAFLRKCMGRHEHMMQDLLEGTPLLRGRFKPQVHCFGYVLDFYAEDIKLAIEVDGSVHGDRLDQDRMRDIRLFQKGVRTLRFNNGAVEHEPRWVLEQIWFAVRVLEPRQEKLG